MVTPSAGYRLTLAAKERALLQEHGIQGLHLLAVEGLPNLNRLSNLAPPAPHPPNLFWLESAIIFLHLSLAHAPKCVRMCNLPETGW